MKKLSIALIAAVVATGCLGNKLANDYRAAHPGCTGDVEALERGNTGVFDVTGCGVQDVVVRVCEQPRCHYFAASTAVERASFDLNCDASQITHQLLDDGQVGVRGCGQRAVYVATGRGWVLNANTTPEASSAAASTGSPVQPSSAPPASSAGSIAALQDTPTREQVVSFINGVTPRVQPCMTAGQCAVVVMQFSGDGRIVEVTAEGDSAGEYCGGTSYPEPPPGVRECIERELLGATIPPFSQPTYRVRFPFRRSN